MLNPIFYINGKWQQKSKAKISANSSSEITSVAHQPAVFFTQDGILPSADALGYIITKENATTRSKAVSSLEVSTL